MGEPTELNVNVHPRLYGVVDRLLDRNLPHADIADIVDSDQESIAQYVGLKRDLLQKRCERLKAEDEITLELHWHQVVPLLIRRPEEAVLNIELLNGKDTVVGRLLPVSVRNVMLAKDSTVPESKYRLVPPNSGSSGTGGLATWLFPACHKPTLARSRYGTVEMEVAVKLQHLVSSPTPQGLGGGGDAASDL